MFLPRVNEILAIGNETYYFTAHPAAKDMPYGQSGRKATVFQLQGRDGKRRALKVFTARYRSEENLYKTNELLKYAALPGLATCERFVISKRQFPSLIQQNRDLNYSVLMPWIEGHTWQDIVLYKKRLDKDRCLSTAIELNRVLATMEASNVAHCDLSGPNLILRPENYTDLEEDPISLIDLEEMYAPDLSKPSVLPGGSAGYAHSTASKGVWSPYADRFAGSVLLANMLAWSDPAVIDSSYGENYFSPDEMHTNSTRYQKLSNSLEKTWGKPTSELFSSAWYSKELEECPCFADWASEFKLDIEEIVLPASQTQPTQFSREAEHAPDSLYQPHPSWKATRYDTSKSRQWENQTPITINKNSPVAGFRPLYSGTQATPQFNTPLAQTQPSATGKSNLRSDFTEMNRLADWIEQSDATVKKTPTAKPVADKKEVGVPLVKQASTEEVVIAIFTLLMLILLFMAIFAQ